MVDGHRLAGVFEGVIVGELTAEATEPGQGAAVAAERRGLASVIDAVLFLAILGFSAIALLALALAAPLAIAATAVAGALSALTARGAKRGGWRIAGV